MGIYDGKTTSPIIMTRANIERSKSIVRGSFFVEWQNRGTV